MEGCTSVDGPGLKCAKFVYHISCSHEKYCDHLGLMTHENCCDHIGFEDTSAGLVADQTHLTQSELACKVLQLLFKLCIAPEPKEAAVNSVRAAPLRLTGSAIANNETPWLSTGLAFLLLHARRFD